MSTKSKKKEEYTISSLDIVKLCKTHRKKIIGWTIFFALLVSLYRLSTAPMEYVVKGTFKEKGTSSAHLSLASAIFSGGGSISKDNEAVSVMKSRKLMEQVVRDLNLQASFGPKTKKPLIFSETLDAISRNLKIEYAFFSERKTPLFPDPQPSLKVIDIIYPNEVSSTLDIKFTTDNDYEVFNHDMMIGQGELNKPFQSDKYHFTIEKDREISLKSQDWILYLSPMSLVVDGVLGNISIQSDHNDKNLIVFSYKNPDRILAGEIITHLMLGYQNYLQKELNRITSSQIAYLEKKQTQVRANLEKVMVEYAAGLASDLSHSGFIDSNKAMDFLGSTLTRYKSKLVEINLEVERLQSAINENYANYEAYSASGDSNIINNLLSEIRSLKQQRDSLNIALRGFSNSDEEIHKKNFITQIAELEGIKQSVTEATMAMDELQSGKIPSEPTRLISDSRYRVKQWIDKLIELKDETEDFSKDTQEKQNEFIKSKEQFATYLANLIHLFKVHEKILEERLAHQQNSQQELQGIELETARELYLGYSKELHTLEGLMLQHEFVSNQLQQPHFEISSLSSILDDQVASQMVTKASGIVLALRDQNNRSVKEQERLKEELSLQKDFLVIHLKQSSQLLELKQNLLKDKIKTLQNLTLGLVQQRISILESHLQDYIATRLKDLKQEKAIIKLHETQLKKDLKTIPEQWVAEKLIDQKIKMQQKMMEDITNNVELRIIASNLEVVQSTPLDLPTPPILPKSPRLMLFASLGAFMGAIFAVTFLVLQAILHGVKASKVNLDLAGQHVSGIISNKLQQTPTNSLLDSDLATLRRLMDWVYGFSPNENPTGSLAKTSQTLLIIQNRGPDYSHHLATLMAMKGLRVLLLPVSFDKSVGADDLPGLLQYLKGAAPSPKISHGADYDYLSPGGVDRFSNELLQTPAFQALLKDLSQKYDRIIAISHTKPTDAETEGLLKIFDHAAITLIDETLPDLSFFLELEKSSKNRISFVLTCAY